MKLPQAKSKNIVVQSVGAETLVYDLITNKAYNLNQTSTIVFNACSSQSSFDELKEKYNYTDELIYLALDDLKRNDLLAEDYQSKYAGFSRREVIKRVGLATMIALPVITGIVAPSAVEAQSGSCLVGTCIPAGQNICPSGCSGRTVLYDAYRGNNGCTGTPIGSIGPSACPGQVDAIGDNLLIISVT